MRPINRLSLSAMLLCAVFAGGIQAAHAQVTLSNSTNYSVGSSPGVVIQADINGDGKPRNARQSLLWRRAERRRGTKFAGGLS